MTELYRVSMKATDDYSSIEDIPNTSGEDNQRAPVPQVRAGRRVNLLKVLVTICVLLVAGLVSLSVYHFIKLNNKEQDLEELRIEVYKLTSNNSALLAAHAVLKSQYERNNSFLQESRETLLSEYTTLNEELDELSKEFSKLQEYYCDVTNTSHNNSCLLCKVGWILFRSKCYFFSINILTWKKSHDWCLAIDGQLVKIENLEEWDFVTNQAVIIAAQLNRYWIGQCDISTCDDYKGNFLEIQLNPISVKTADSKTIIHWICESAVFPLRI